MDTGDIEVDDSGHSDTINESNNVDSIDLDKADLDAMKGDTIGDTVYSGKWILKTLIALSKVYENEWSGSLESDLCTLWDMTAEKDVVFFLKDNDFLKIAEFTLEISKEPRLTEIIIGIIGNMCCQPAILETVANSDNLTLIMLGLLSTNDIETLLQILRLLQSVVWNIQENPETKWLRRLLDCQFLGDGLCFILQSSTNENLLSAAVDLLNAISNIETAEKGCLLMELTKINQLVPALIESFMQFIPKKDMTHSRLDLKFIENWLTIFSNIMQSQIEIFSRELDDDKVVNIMQVLLKILQPYVNPSNLLPLDERLALCIHDCVVMTSWFRRNKNYTDSKITSVVVTIMHQLRHAIKEDSKMDGFIELEETKDLAKYLEKYWLVNLHECQEHDILEMLQLCEESVIQSLMDVAKEYSTEFPDAIDKLIRVQSL
ncbi:uncharacterized protein [Venturia canescens]|uniref:uncharacterized protein n=1 Tax=Venturia canescens TaxID=32260 RepID=UPI001C9C64B2|nr:uncharacterized protein LOC122405862 [Venturia canescens]XP_043266840.1 uncharacterized protein LOC122405862 [Venturia canescens]